MKAAVLEELNQPLTLREVGLTELRFGQVLVKVLVSGLCGAQLHEIKGHKGNGKFLPHLMGHEGCGIVESVGIGVTTVKPGDKVVMHWRPGSGVESPFPSYTLDGKTISSGKVTTLSEFSIVSENRVTKISSDTPSVLAAMLGCSLTTALGIIDNECELKFGESVAVLGCGGVGLNLIQAAKMKSASPIYGVDVNKNMFDLSTQLGADYFVYDIEYLADKFDVIIDTTGVPDVISKAFERLKPGGRLILVGQPAPDRIVCLPNAVSMFDGSGKSIRATQGGRTDPEKDIPRYINLAMKGKLDYETLHTHTFTLDEVNEAFDLLRSGNAGRIMVKINES
ncbi:alcohol dehydrogenase catalytic domain-containing protein [Pseudomonadales bacterium]|nr:alcohol dehydrogenase catalytic domain-containing protein [Pseudomonadales bacterium]